MNVQLWKDRGSRTIDPELFSAQADELAKLVNSERTQKINNPTQIRKFYDEIVRFQGLLQVKWTP